MSQTKRWDPDSTKRASSGGVTGTTAVATTSDTAVEALAANATDTYLHVRIANGGTAAGFYSIDGGTTWTYLPAGASVHDWGVRIVNKAIQVKRIPSGSDLASIYVSAW
jgi:hypothetical protein